LLHHLRLEERADRAFCKGISSSGHPGTIAQK